MLIKDKIVGPSVPLFEVLLYNIMIMYEHILSLVNNIYAPLAHIHNI